MSRLIWPKIDGVIKDLALWHPKIWGMPDGPSLITFYWVIRSGWFFDMSKPNICPNKQYMCELDWYQFRGDIMIEREVLCLDMGLPRQPHHISPPPPH